MPRYAPLSDFRPLLIHVFPLSAASLRVNTAGAADDGIQDGYHYCSGYGIRTLDAWPRLRRRCLRDDPVLLISRNLRLPRTILACRNCPGQVRCTPDPDPHHPHLWPARVHSCRVGRTHSTPSGAGWDGFEMRVARLRTTDWDLDVV
ncbi:hypothetical protein C8R44DRAFT_754386 [Mycena epipterygia]|nr:hypothetical protein C8R44DRAFT_754386 [Mycena epipterygia]